MRINVGDTVFVYEMEKFYENLDLDPRCDGAKRHGFRRRGIVTSINTNDDETEFYNITFFDGTKSTLKQYGDGLIVMTKEEYIKRCRGMAMHLRINAEIAESL